MVKNKTIRLLFFAFVFVILSGCNYPRVHIRANITSPENEQTVILNEETRIITRASATRGIQSVKLFVNDSLIHTDTPSEGTPIEYTANQPWIPVQEGNAVISVIAIDMEGRVSEPFIISLQVIQSISELEETPTPEVTITPEGFDQTQTAQAICTNEATFIEHITIPINANMLPEANFTKVWRIKNNGTCDWIDYQLIHISGDLLEANTPVSLPMIGAGNNADISIDMKAPGEPGSHSSTWRIKAADGTVFGPDLPVTIIVPQPPTDTPTPTSTFTPTATFTPTPTFTPTIPPITVEQVSKEIKIEGNSSDQVVAACPSGSVVVGGGFAGTDGLRIWQSRRDGNAWRVNAKNNTAAEKTLTVYASCLINSGGTSRQEMNEININADGITQVAVSCPSGSLVTGGGWNIGSLAPVEIIHSSQSDNGWYIYVNNTGVSNPEVFVYVTCLTGATGSTSQYRNADGLVPGNNSDQLVENCPPNTIITGGGFETDIDVIIIKSWMSGNGWQNFAQNYTGTQKDWSTFAICYSP